MYSCNMRAKNWRNMWGIIPQKLGKRKVKQTNHQVLLMP